MSVVNIEARRGRWAVGSPDPTGGCKLSDMGAGTRT